MQKEWRERFERLAGSPLFAVVRQDAAPARDSGAASSRRLAVTTTLRPDRSASVDHHCRKAGERPPAGGARRRMSDRRTPRANLSDVLNGILDPRAGRTERPASSPATCTRKPAKPISKSLKSADISRIDRGDTKSVRVVFDVTPKFLSRSAAAPFRTVAAAPTQQQDPGAVARRRAAQDDELTR